MSADRQPIFVKTCGLRSTGIAEAAIAAGADAIGIMLAPSKRRISLEDAIALRRALEATYSHMPLFVAVTVNPADDAIRQIAASDVFDAIQLSGDEDRAITARIPASLQVWKALRPAPQSAAEDVLHEVATWLEGEKPADRVLLDAYHPGAYGGSGVVGNWGVAAMVSRRFPIILAGGLTPENVREAIDQVQPFGVDVSSGIETDGAKDPARIASFLRAAKSRAGSPALRTA